MRGVWRRKREVFDGAPIVATKRKAAEKSGAEETACPTNRNLGSR